MSLVVTGIVVALGIHFGLGWWTAAVAFLAFVLCAGQEAS